MYCTSILSLNNPVRVWSILLTSSILVDEYASSGNSDPFGICGGGGEGGGEREERGGEGERGRRGRGGDRLGNRDRVEPGLREETGQLMLPPNAMLIRTLSASPYKQESHLTEEFAECSNEKQIRVHVGHVD